MSRSVKFRAWDSTHHEWVDYGFCLRFDKDGNGHILDAFARPFTDRTLVLMEWSGVTNEQGQDIYEEDSVRNPYTGQEGVVTWMPPLVSFVVLSHDGVTGYDLHAQWHVVGNRYEGKTQ